jgi:frataxin
MFLRSRIRLLISRNITQPLVRRKIVNRLSTLTRTFTTPTVTSLQPAYHRTFSTTMTEGEFDNHADDFLEELMDNLEVLENTAGPDFEIDYAMGVLTLVLNEDTTYIINKQRPNRQVWMSSPKSGPRRFELDNGALGNWVDVRTRENLLDIMKVELQELVPDIELDL